MINEIRLRMPTNKRTQSINASIKEMLSSKFDRRKKHTA